MYRERVLWTQVKLGEEAGVNSGQIYRYENGKSKPTETVLRKLASALGVTFEKLIGNEKAIQASISTIEKNQLREKFEHVLKLEISDSERQAIAVFIDLLIYKRKIQALQ